jgi:hypothetical protein
LIAKKAGYLARAAGRQHAWRTFGFSGHICFMDRVLTRAGNGVEGEHA